MVSMYPTVTSAGHHVVFSRPIHERGGTDLVIVLHGYGSDEKTIAADIFPWLPAETTGVAVRGGFPIEEDSNMYGWFLIDYFLNNDFAEVIAAAHRIYDLLDAEEITREKFSSVSLLGFSQGMAMASTAVRLRPEQFRAVVGLSGFVISNPLLETLDNPPEGPGPLPYFWGRDDQDPVINPAAIDHTADWLENNTVLTAKTYPGMGHHVGAEMARDAQIFLEEQLLG